MFVNDPNFGNIIDFDVLRGNMRQVYDSLLPDFNMLKSMRSGTVMFNDDPNLMIAAGASMLAWMMIVAAGAEEIAEELKDSLFTLGWTEEAIGSDLLSASTVATPMSDDPEEVNFHVTGKKWLINNSFHADYHMVVAKTDPTANGPRSLSIFLVPRSSTSNWQRLETHVLQKMVLTTFDIDGPGRLVGKVGHGLTILQKMAMPSKYQCSYVGVRMLHEAIPAAIDHLSSKRIFGDNPINFSNVFRQLYNIVLQSALLEFVYYRALAFSDGAFLQFHGTMLKSWFLLRANELLGQNLLVAGSKGFLKESVIGRDAIDSFVLPVFDGHYTINTLMTAKHMKRYLNADIQADMQERVDTMRREMYYENAGDQMNADSRKLRNPEFFDYAAYIESLELPIDLDGSAIVASVRALIEEIDTLDLSSDPEYKYKVGTMVHWMEAVIAACELWKVTEEDEFLNTVIMQYNAFVNEFNQIISEGALQMPFMTPMRQRPIGIVDDPKAFLLRLHNLKAVIRTNEHSAIVE